MQSPAGKASGPLYSNKWMSSESSGYIPFSLKRSETYLGPSVLPGSRTSFLLDGLFEDPPEVGPLELPDGELLFEEPEPPGPL